MTAPQPSLPRLDSAAAFSARPSVRIRPSAQPSTRGMPVTAVQAQRRDGVMVAPSSSSSSAYRPALFATAFGSPLLSVVAPAGASAPQLRAVVTGPARLAFFKRPLRALIAEPQRPTHAALEVALSSSSSTSSSPSPFSTPSAPAMAHSAAAVPTKSPGQPSPPPPRVSRGVQSEFRDGWAQTVPYSPDVLLDAEPSAAVAELLRLQSSLSFAAGSLPARLAEVEAIAATRERAAWDAALPSLTSAENCAERQRLVEAREWNEWEEKERRQRAEDESRMLRLVDAMRQREDQHRRSTERLVTERRRDAEERAARAEERRRDERRRAARVLGKQRLREERRGAFLTGGLLDVSAPALAAAGGGILGPSAASSALLSGLGSDPVFSAAEFGSSVYAPLARSGAVRAARGRRAIVDFDIPALSDFAALGRFAQRESDGAAEALRPAHMRAASRAALQQRRHLGRVDAAIAEHKEQLSAREGTGSSQAPLNVYKSFQPVQRASTPSLPETAASDAALSVAACALQRLLRGRALQNRTLRGVDSQQGLIHELLDDEPDAASEPVLEQQRQPERERARDDDDEATALVDCLLGAVWSDGAAALTLWSAQWAQLQCLDSLRLEADFVRRVRESEEGGRRQAQEERRRERERHVERVTRLTQHHVAAPHVHAIVQQALARWTAAQTAAQCTAAAPVPEGTATEEAVESVVASLLDELLFPAVASQASTSFRALSQRRALNSAHDAAQWVVLNATAFGDRHSGLVRS